MRPNYSRGIRCPWPNSAHSEWHIDPLDGTTNLSCFSPLLCTSIALAIESEPGLGVIYDPIRNWTFYGMKGFGSYRNGNRLCVSKRTTLADSLLATGFPYDRWSARPNNTHRFAHLLRKTHGFGRAGAAARTSPTWRRVGWMGTGSAH